MITGHVSAETIGSTHTTAEYAEGSTLSVLPHNDAIAKELLSRSSLRFDIVDLSDGIGTRLAARLKGIRETPCLLDEQRIVRRYVGLDQIRKYIVESNHVNEN